MARIFECGVIVCCMQLDHLLTYKSLWKTEEFMSEVRHYGCWVSSQQQLESEFGNLINIDETREANYWPFRGLAHQCVLSATHASSVTCFQTCRQWRRNFSKAPPSRTVRFVTRFEFHKVDSKVSKLIFVIECFTRHRIQMPRKKAIIIG